jgi:peptidoglycan L-alanyl-D-glutamate endopeptidase CwlK
MGMASRRIEDLSADTAHKYWMFDAGMKAAGIDYLVTCTYRSEQEQQALFDQGRNTPGKIVTNAPPGRSAHNCTDPVGNPAARAFDVVPMVNGKPDWDGSHPDWERTGRIGESVGLEWAGRWHSFPEKPHFQLPHWDANYGH